MNIQCTNCGEWICDTAHIRILSGGTTEFICKSTKQIIEENPTRAINNLAKAIGTFDAEERKLLVDHIVDLEEQLEVANLQNRALLAACKAAYTMDHNRPYPVEIIGQLREAIDLCQREKQNQEGLRIGESRNLPYPKPINDDDAKKRKCEGVPIPANTRCGLCGEIH